MDVGGRCQPRFSLVESRDPTFLPFVTSVEFAAEDSRSPQIAAAFRRFCGDPAAVFRASLGKFEKWICVWAYFGDFWGVGWKWWLVNEEDPHARSRQNFQTTV